MAILQATEFQDFTGKVRIQFDELVGTGKNWLAPARILGLDVVAFVTLLKDKYKAQLTIYRDDENKIKWIGYHWENLADARRYKNILNAKAREKGVTKENLIKSVK